jgi:hypothetical protein
MTSLGRVVARVQKVIENKRLVRVGGASIVFVLFKVLIDLKIFDQKVSDDKLDEPEEVGDIKEVIDVKVFIQQSEHVLDDVGKAARLAQVDAKFV